MRAISKSALSTAVFMAACALAGTARAGTITIDTTPSWDGSSTVWPWGHNGATQTYGQTVTAPAFATSLENFSFIVQDVNDYLNGVLPGPIKYQAYVYAWDSVNVQPTGPALYQSAVQQTPGTNTGNFMTLSFATAGTAVFPGTQYVLFLTTDGIANPTDGNTAWAFPFADVYSGGQFQFLNDSIGTWQDSSSFSEPAAEDLIFTAAFKVPEPAPLGLLVVGLGVFGMLRMSNRSASARKA